MLPVIASRKELRMDSEGATESRRHCGAVADLEPRSRKSRPTVYRSERSPGRLGAWYARWALRVFRSRPVWRHCGRARPPRARMIDKYNQAFQEDVREILLELESARLELNERRDDPKLVALMEPVPKIPTG